ncbi:MAG TPA: CBS domain-containing protein [Cryptosporangiaceae bacterium]|nr:CBS domain-containing protein [Cryptosporangiaceae bacterium]
MSARSRDPRVAVEGLSIPSPRRPPDDTGSGAGRTSEQRPTAAVDRPVTELMSQPVLAVRNDTALAWAVEALAGPRARHLAVVDADGRCLGVLADRTVMLAWARNPVDVHRRCGDVLPPGEVAVVARTATVAEAVRDMRLSGTDAVAVVDETGHPVGMLSAADVLALLDRTP